MKYKIPHIDIHSSTDKLYCPVTGQQLLHPEYFDPSPATIFNYFDDYKEFNEVTPEVKELYNKCLQDLEINKADTLEPFYILVNEKLQKYHDRYLLLEIGDTHANLFYCFNMALDPETKKLDDEHEPHGRKTQKGMHEAGFHLEFKKFFCPATGIQLVHSNGFSPSPALEFIYSHKIGSFKLINDSLKEKFSAYFSGEEHSSNQKELYKKLTSEVFSKTKHHLLLTYGKSGDEISICVDMTDQEFATSKKFTESDSLKKEEK